MKQRTLNIFLRKPYCRYLYRRKRVTKQIDSDLSLELANTGIGIWSKILPHTIDKVMIARREEKVPKVM